MAQHGDFRAEARPKGGTRNEASERPAVVGIPAGA